jgi:hypothetical protein
MKVFDSVITIYSLMLPGAIIDCSHESIIKSRKFMFPKFDGYHRIDTYICDIYLIFDVSGMVLYIV